MAREERVDAFLDALEGRKIWPRLIAMDEHLVALGSRFVRQNDVSRDGLLYFSKGGPDST
jgi:hypothetical protein